MKTRKGDGVAELASLIPRLKSISDRELRDKTAEIYLELFNRSKWKRLSDHFVTAELKVSDIEHTNAVVEISLHIAQIVKETHGVSVNTDWLISAAILHDASKLTEFEPTKEGQRKTKSGEFYQHTLECLSMMISKNLPMEVVHAVLSHTPESTVVPKTIEAVLLHFADAVDYNVLRMANGLGPDMKK